jgi:hypothetical protein
VPHDVDAYGSRRDVTLDADGHVSKRAHREAAPIGARSSREEAMLAAALASVSTSSGPGGAAGSRGGGGAGGAASRYTGVPPSAADYRADERGVGGNESPSGIDEAYYRGAHDRSAMQMSPADRYTYGAPSSASRGGHGAYSGGGSGRGHEAMSGAAAASRGSLLVDALSAASLSSGAKASSGGQRHGPLPHGARDGHAHGVEGFTTRLSTGADAGYGAPRAAVMPAAGAASRQLAPTGSLTLFTRGSGGGAAAGGSLGNLDAGGGSATGVVPSLARLTPRKEGGGADGHEGASGGSGGSGAYSEGGLMNGRRASRSDVYRDRSGDGEGGDDEVERAGPGASMNRALHRALQPSTSGMYRDGGESGRSRSRGANGAAPGVGGAGAAAAAAPDPGRAGGSLGAVAAFGRILSSLAGGGRG